MEDCTASGALRNASPGHSCFPTYTTSTRSWKSYLPSVTMAALAGGAEFSPRAGSSMESDSLMDAETGSHVTLSPKTRAARAHAHTTPKEVRL